MERYLTKKCRPGKGVKLMENAAMVVGFVLFALCIAVTAYVVVTYVQSMGLIGLGWQNFLLLIPAVLLALVLNPLGERIRSRKHAQVIVEKLQKAGGFVQADEAEATIGVRRAAETAMALVEKGYLTDVRLDKGFLLLGGMQADLPDEKPVVQLFRDVEV